MPDAFASDMWSVYRSLLAIGKYTKTTDLGISLLFWVSWVQVKASNSAQRFGMSGNGLAFKSVSMVSLFDSV
jgi:hypothetical protein